MSSSEFVPPDFRAIQELFRSALPRISQADRAVIEMRYGLKGEPPRTLAEVEASLGVTRDEIRRISNDALAKAAE